MTEKLASQPEVLEEFSILELEERLEFAMCCDYQCGPNTNCDGTCPPPVKTGGGD